MRCGPLGTSWHVTAKSSICGGVGFINLASTQGEFCVLPWEICEASGASRPRERPPYPDWATGGSNRKQQKDILEG
jgi:hypothetical protein